MAKKDEMLAHKERNGSERNIFVRSASIVAVDPELAPFVSYHMLGYLNAYLEQRAADALRAPQVAAGGPQRSTDEGGVAPKRAGGRQRYCDLTKCADFGADEARGQDNAYAQPYRGSSNPPWTVPIHQIAVRSPPHPDQSAYAGQSK